MLKEALERMLLLELHPNAVREFEKEGKLNLSERFGALFWLDEAQEKMVREWEKKTGNLVYHAIRNFYDIGEMLSLLYVSRYPEEWPEDRAGIGSGEVLAYVINVDDDICSEFGYIGIRPIFGGVVRTC